jgi:di/tricarboxylate transporter
MLVLGRVPDRLGAVTLLVGALTPPTGANNPWLALALIYAVPSVQTRLLTRKAVAVLMSPVAVGLAARLGIDFHPFGVAAMFAAWASYSARSATGATRWSAAQAASASPNS